MYSIVQFLEQDGASVSIVRADWFTPRKQEVFWPPVKEGKSYNKYLLSSSPDSTWKTYGIQRSFYETDDLEKAKKKLKLVEVTSDLQTDAEEIELERPKRKLYRKQHISDSENESDRPPALKKQFLHCLSAAKSHNSTEISNRNCVSKQALSGCVFRPNDKRTVPGAGSSPKSDQQCDDVEINSNHNSSYKLSYYEEKVVSMLASLQAQNQQIIALLKEKGIRSAALTPIDFKFPLQTEEDLVEVENLLQDQTRSTELITFLSSLGGRDFHIRVYRILKHVMVDSLAAQFNFYGKRSTKKPFADLRLRAVVIDSVRIHHPEASHKDIEDAIKTWLKHAPERVKRCASISTKTDLTLD